MGIIQMVLAFLRVFFISRAALGVKLAQNKWGQYVYRHDELVQIRDWLRGHLWRATGRGSVNPRLRRRNEAASFCPWQILFRAICASARHLRRPVRNSPFFHLRAPLHRAILDSGCMRTERKV